MAKHKQNENVCVSPSNKFGEHPTYQSILLNFPKKSLRHLTDIIKCDSLYAIGYVKRAVVPAWEVPNRLQHAY